MFDILKIVSGWGETATPGLSNSERQQRTPPGACFGYTTNQPRATSLLPGLYNPEEIIPGPDALELETIL